MKYCINLTAILFFLLISTTAFATMYKSVDKDGNVTYSQSPPKTGHYEKIKAKKYKPVAPDATQKSLDAKKSFEQGTQTRNENDLVKSELEKNKKIQQQNCEIAKKNLRLFTVYKRIKKEDGEYYRVDDNERAQRIKTAEGNIKEFCN